MAFTNSIRLLTPIVRSMVASGPKACLSKVFIHDCKTFSSIASAPRAVAPTLQQFNQIRRLGSDPRQTYSRDSDPDAPQSLTQILETEIQEETIELNKSLSSDQFPGFSVETDDADIKLTKQVGDATVVVRFTVSSSLSEWKTEAVSEQSESQQQEGYNFSLLSMPEFQVQIVRGGKTLEVSCYFEEMEHDEESGETYPSEPIFHIDEIVMYDGEPRETEFAVSTEYFREELQEGLLQYLAEQGVDDEFAKNLVSFSTNYEKKLYISLMKRLKDFVAK